MHQLTYFSIVITKQFGSRILSAFKFVSALEYPADTKRMKMIVLKE